MKWSRQSEGEVRVQSVPQGWQLSQMHGPRDPLAAATEAVAILEVGGYGLSDYQKCSICFVFETFVFAPYLRNLLPF